MRGFAKRRGLPTCCLFLRRRSGEWRVASGEKKKRTEGVGKPVTDVHEEAANSILRRLRSAEKSVVSRRGIWEILRLLRRRRGITRRKTGGRWRMRFEC